MRRQLVIGNWKMNGSRQANQQLVSDFLALWQAGPGSAGVAMAPPAVYLDQLAQLLEGSDVALGAQDVSEHPAGAYTGELAASMLHELGCRFALVGHSERRAYHGESSDRVARKALAALSAGLTPVVCLGETLAQREAGLAEAVVVEQLRAVLACVPEPRWPELVLAYEPVWAIGTGKTASPGQAQALHAFIRGQLGEQGQAVRLLYGGSVKPDNAAELFAQADIDGALVGGAALVADDFYQICRSASGAG